MGEPIRYGVISDTHGSVHPKVFDVFAGVRRIFHCGDIGSPNVITDLQAIAPVQIAGALLVVGAVMVLGLRRRT